ncbi:GAF domain-containing protein [Nocardia iowensis]|uniref:DUF5593 domain-containing protein n=1 Tax=Nocardia iowensis TaxID=204891 RepID=A0ABX8S4A6_NOCIO|nr:GAF domain-containing protein [Nocardia iowensis]QXN94711.1 DUF5593 domain-containing protein [Nocardia iowensis]
MERAHDEVLIETIGSDPRVVWAASQARDARITNVFRGAEGMLMQRLVQDVVKSRVSTVRSGREGNATGRVYAAYPVVGPDNAVSGVQILYGPKPEHPTAATAAYQWELDVNDGPPRLHATPELLDILEVPERQRDRPSHAYGPVDFFTRVERLADLVRMWEAILTAEPGHAATGTVIIRTSSGRPGLLLYAERCVKTEAGPRLRVVCRDITDTVDPRQLRIDMLDMSMAKAAVSAQGMYGFVLDARWPSTCIVKWLSALAPGFGHGVSTGATPGVHPDDQRRVPAMVKAALETGSVQDTFRIRPGFGADNWVGQDGWLTINFNTWLIDPEVSQTLALSLIYPNTDKPPDT